MNTRPFNEDFITNDHIDLTNYIIDTDFLMSLNNIYKNKSYIRIAHIANSKCMCEFSTIEQLLKQIFVNLIHIQIH